MKDRIKHIVTENAGEILDIRRHLHANPELSFKEYETSKFVTATLDKWGIPYKDGFVETGIVAHIEGEPSIQDNCPARRYGCASHFRSERCTV